LNGGTLEDSGVPADEYPAEVATFLFHYARFILHFINCLKGQPSNLDKVVSRACPHGDIKAGPTRGGFTDVSVSYQNRVLAARVVSRGGQWLEEVATVALREAGANELFSGVVWGWPTQVLDRFEDHGVGRNRSEVDVLARMGYRYLAVECKAGSSQTLAAASKGIEAVALAGLGRFGIPVVLRPVIPRQLIEASLKSKSRAVLLDLRTLLDTAELKKILSSVFANRSTFQSDD
jgi:Holliday junction resolvase